jgi:predicted RNA binding protein YcfA (HicA-like mRNA interferase family)
MPSQAKKVLRKRKRAGFEERREGGSHLVLRHKDGRQTYSPIYIGNVPTSTFRCILKQAGLTEEEYRER